jgi:hypothetical protein
LFARLRQRGAEGVYRSLKLQAENPGIELIHHRLRGFA